MHQAHSQPVYETEKKLIEHRQDGTNDDESSEIWWNIRLVNSILIFEGPSVPKVKDIKMYLRALKLLGDNYE